jgi:hypothetical protein
MQKEKNHNIMEIWMIEIWPGLDEVLPVYASQINLTMRPEYTGMQDQTKLMVENLEDKMKDLQEIVSQLSMEVKVITAIADDWHMKANTIRH